MSKRKAQPHKFGHFDVRGIRITGGWLPSVNRDYQCPWKDRTEGMGDPAPRPWPEAKGRKR